METTDRWLNLLHVELGHTSDRSCAIVGASIIETLLLDLLKACLVAGPTAKDEFFEGTNAPLGTFSARIDLAYRLGLISSQRGICILVRKIRNDFAHRVEGPSFSEGGINSQVNELLRSLRLKDRAPFLLTAPYDTPRGHFMVCAVMFIMFLDERLQAGPKHIAPASLDYIYTTSITERKKGTGTSALSPDEPA